MTFFEAIVYIEEQTLPAKDAQFRSEVVHNNDTGRRAGTFMTCTQVFNF
jgi:hypothetical protein